MNDQLALGLNDQVDPEPLAIDPESLVPLATLASVNPSTRSGLSTLGSFKSFEFIRNNASNSPDAEVSIVMQQNIVPSEQYQQGIQFEPDSAEEDAKCWSFVAICVFGVGSILGVTAWVISLVY
ncbi:MAG: hypothetical protein LBQ43_04175 [Holosporales bacterium]|nr:hypothetical protein [Holosporales bacterium]